MKKSVADMPGCMVLRTDDHLMSQSTVEDFITETATNGAYPYKRCACLESSPKLCELSCVDTAMNADEQ